MTSNEQAFLSMLAISEGTAHLGDSGYNVIVGGKLFDSYADHPRVLVKLSSKLSSTAAGRYQILERTFDAYKERIGLKDFSPTSQDAIALRLIEECRARKLINQGRIRDAINACSSRWASLPGAGFGQRENSPNDLIRAYQRAGGTVA